MNSPSEMIIIIPARAGSSRIKNKNMIEVGGKPLLQHTLDLVLELGLASSACVSSDSLQMLDLASSHGFIPIARPHELASDSASTESVILHCINELMRSEYIFKYILTLPPTSPFRSAATLQDAVNTYLSKSFCKDSLFSVTRCSPDLWEIDSLGNPRRVFACESRRQQDRPLRYEENSAFYITSVTSFLRYHFILGDHKRSILYEISPIEGFDINTEHDLMIADAIFRSRIPRVA